MMRASGIFILVFFCWIKSFSQDSLSGLGKAIIDSDSIHKYNQLSSELLGREPEKALDYSNKALSAATILNFKPGMAKAMANLGQLYLDKGETSTALEYFNNYYRLSLELQDSLLLADAYCQLGGVYRRQQIYQTALSYYYDALSIAKEKDYEGILRQCYNQLGGLYYFKKNYRLANRYFFRSLHFINPETDKAEYAAALNNIGVVYKADKQYRKSLSYLKQALTLLEELKNTRDLSVVMMNIGEIYQVYNDYDLAEMYFNKALEAARKVKAVDRIVESYEYLAGLMAEKENFKLAYEYQTLYAAYKDTLALNEQRNRLQELSKKLEVERQEQSFKQLMKDKEIELLNKEFKISKLEGIRKNHLIYLSGIISMLVTLLALVFYSGNRTKRKQNEQLEDQNRRTHFHNRQLQEVNEKLKQSEHELRSLVETKDKFFSIISHDLRGPLYTLSGFIQIMKKDIGVFTPAELSRFSIQMERSLQGTTALLDNLFQWASSQTGLIEFAPAELKLNKVVEENKQLLQSAADLKEISLINSVPPDLSLTADIQMMRLVLRNLMANAIKFTEKGGWVKVQVREAEEETIICVEDNGIGMSKKDQDGLFRHKRIPSQRGTDNEKGSGLGLLLCKEFVEMHKGSLRVQSSEGGGSIFCIHIPKVA
ncbi:tetratricopeptide repeat-containing sensor histidine kinase [Nafulsella turpanensis]|uniref:tetratricopeptide repeat-containing sensor histidine kinase n=1 Tax=Nafulsella turpanensis TaxID=1265690 RepID=UPI00037BB71E|nr:tetratricopeptide repeat protein [Nafulsella turpanensis]